MLRIAELVLRGASSGGEPGGHVRPWGLGRWKIGALPLGWPWVTEEAEVKVHSEPFFRERCLWGWWLVQRWILGVEEGLVLKFRMSS